MTGDDISTAVRYWRSLRAAGWRFTRHVLDHDVVEWCWQAPDHWAGARHKITLELTRDGVWIELHHGPGLRVIVVAHDALTPQHVIDLALLLGVVGTDDLGDADDLMALADALVGDALVRGAA